MKDKHRRRHYKGTIIGIVLLIFLISIISVSLYLTGNPSSEKVLKLATTTSTANSGLLDEILPDFEEEYDVSVRVIPVGTGQALEMGKRGDVDVLMVHSPNKEEEFVDQGYGAERYPVCYNYFVILGPPSDPAGIRDVSNASEAMKRIIASNSKFVSRGDDSGTHTKEKELWASAGFDYSSEIDIPQNEWYYSVSAGMGDTLIRANELEAHTHDVYTLSDEGTFWAFDGNIELELVLREDLALLNEYSVIPLNPGRSPHVNYMLSMDFVHWITSNETQDRIENYEKNGHKLFSSYMGIPREINQESDLEKLDSERLMSITLLTLYMAGCSTTISALIGIPLGTYLGIRKTKFATLIKVFTHTLYGLPPVIAGLLVFILLSRAGPLGSMGILFTPTAMIFAQVILITPLIIGLSASAISSIPSGTIDTARTLGARRTALLKTLVVESRIGIFTAIMIGFGRAISEVGAVIIVGGNIKWHTQVLTTSIVLETQKGNFYFALLLGAILITLALITAVILTILQSKFRVRRPVNNFKNSVKE
jgi:tungstate transport system substrate-binding protein